MVLLAHVVMPVSAHSTVRNASDLQSTICSLMTCAACDATPIRAPHEGSDKRSRGGDELPMEGAIRTPAHEVHVISQSHSAHARVPA